MFADFFGRLAGEAVAVMEVECRSMGGERCRFLVGSGETMQHVYDEMAQGVGYDERCRPRPASSGAARLPRLQRVRVERIRQQLAVDQHLAVPRQHDRALGRERVEVRACTGPSETRRPCALRPRPR